MKSKHSPKVFKIVACLRESRTEGFEISYQIEAEKIFLCAEIKMISCNLLLKNNLFSKRKKVLLHSLIS